MDGRTHLIANVGVGATIIGLTGKFAPDILLNVAAGAIIGTLCTPDWDLKVETETERIMGQWPIVGKPLRLVSHGYSIWIPGGHRGISHDWAWGTLTRALYLGIAYVVIAFTIIGATQTISGESKGVSDFLFGFLKQSNGLLLLILSNLAFFAAWYIQDWTHLVLDL